MEGDRKETQVSGKAIRFNRLFGGGRNAVVVAMDHGAQFGPIDGLVDFRAALGRLKGADGILMNPAMLDHSGGFFAGERAPKLILRTTWTTAYCFPWDYSEAHTCAVMPPAEALYQGAEMVTACCLVQSGSEELDRDNVRLFSKIAREKEHAGIPLIGELYPMQAEQLPEAELHERVYRGARVLVELGADAIKTFFTGERFAEVAGAVPVPVLVLGASKAAEEREALEMAHRAVKAGARGVVFGRNVLQAENPEGFLGALARIVRDGVEPGEVMG